MMVAPKSFQLMTRPFLPWVGESQLQSQLASQLIILANVGNVTCPRSSHILVGWGLNKSASVTPAYQKENDLECLQPGPSHSQPALLSAT